MADQINNVKDVVKVATFGGKGGAIPYGFWSALLDGDLLAPAGIADWLEEQGDVAHADGWREAKAGGYEPLPRGWHESYWLRDGDAAPHAWMPAWNDAVLRGRATVPADVFDCMQAIEDHGGVKARVHVSDVHPYVIKQVGRANALALLALAFALDAAGFTPELYVDQGGRPPRWQPQRLREWRFKVGQTETLEG